MKFRNRTKQYDTQLAKLQGDVNMLAQEVLAQREINELSLKAFHAIGRKFDALHTPPALAPLFGRKKEEAAS